VERIAIAGGGIIGCSVAWELARRGASVDLFDPRPLGAGATQASAGMLVPYIEGHDAGPLLELGVRSFAMYDDFVAGVAADGATSIEYRQVGSLELSTDPARHAWLRTEVEQQRGGPAQWVDGDALRELEPAVTTACTGARLVEAHRYVVVATLVDALHNAASAHGARVHVGRGVAGFDPGDKSVRLTCTDGGILDFDRVILAAGCWTPAFGPDDPAARAVRPVRGQLLRLQWPTAPLTHILWGPDCYVVPWVDGTILVGATMEDVGYDERTTVAGVRDLLEGVSDLLPDAWGATFLEARVGLRPGNADGLPIIGPSSGSDRVIYATGHSRNGILLAPLTAALVGDLVVNGRVDPALARLSPGRKIVPPTR
jgi:glycine oxidase